MKAKVLEILGEIGNGKLRAWLDSGNEVFEPIELEDGRFFSLLEIANEKTFEPSTRFIITDKDPRIKFTCMEWSKGKNCFGWEITTKIKGTLWYDYDSTEEMEAVAAELIKRDNVMEVKFQKVRKGNDDLSTYSIIYKELNENGRYNY